MKQRPQSFFSRDGDFTPLPLLGNPHIQTVLALFLGGPTLDYPTHERQVRLVDGDRLLLYDNVPTGWRPGGRIAVVVHGLGGSHRSGHVTHQAVMLLRKGVRVVRLELRAAGRGIAVARHTYHAGSSDDLRAAVAEVHRWSPSSPIFVVGQSLGGNVALKLAGEAAGDPVPGLAGVVAVGPPIDVARCAALLAEPRNVVSEQFFVRALLGHLQRHRRIFPELPMPRFPRHVTLRLFDELYTAPFGGFAGAEDLYRRTSSLPLIPRIDVPALILAARDDPFIAAEPFEELRGPAHVEVRLVERGGHLGFLGPDGAGGIRWAERTAAAWVLRAG
ncbi:MAG TPA: alpha/beta fold hydrolase [Gemmataceae bacterium]|nr:alpha/beta fold hydrolase [Gemmataceae bacterium]